MRNYDLEFLKHFSMVIGFLVLVTLGLIIGALFLHKSLPPEIDPGAARRTENRIAPAGAVYAGATGAAAQAAAVAAAAAQAASQVAYGGTPDGSVIYQNLCSGCHTRPAARRRSTMRTGTRASPRGKDTLYAHSIDGFTGSTGVMPAKGGNPALSVEQMHAAVDWMIDNLK
ncbi:MAG: c-type cytochrome [Luteimonas sp.]|nr:c-type cytochrome [Luteimonas sp.]